MTWFYVMDDGTQVGWTVGAPLPETGCDFLDPRFLQQFLAALDHGSNCLNVMRFLNWIDFLDYDSPRDSWWWDGQIIGTPGVWGTASAVGQFQKGDLGLKRFPYPPDCSFYERRIGALQVLAAVLWDELDWLRDGTEASLQGMAAPLLETESTLRGKCPTLGGFDLADYSLGFRRKVELEDSFSYGRARIGDMGGPWLLEDLQVLCNYFYDAVAFYEPPQLDADHFWGAYRYKSGTHYGTWEDFEDWWTGADWESGAFSPVAPTFLIRTPALDVSQVYTVEMPALKIQAVAGLSANGVYVGLYCFARPTQYLEDPPVDAFNDFGCEVLENAWAKQSQGQLLPEAEVDFGFVPHQAGTDTPFEGPPPEPAWGDMGTIQGGEGFTQSYGIVLKRTA